jgi:urea transport system permease protein
MTLRPSCLRWIGWIGLTGLIGLVPARAEPIRPRAAVTAAILETDAAEQIRKLKALAPLAGEEVSQWLTAWRNGEILIYTPAEGPRHALQWADEADADGLRAAARLDTGTPLAGSDGKPLRLDPLDTEPADTSAALRRAMKDVTDLARLVHPDPNRRAQAAIDLGLQQAPESLAPLAARAEVETHRTVRHALAEAAAFIRLRHGAPEERLAACTELGAAGALFARDGLRAVAEEAATAGNAPLEKAARQALKQIDDHLARVNTVGTLFRGLSLGSILLVSAIGLAITFGLMGVINMAHGEMMAVGAYTTYVVQCLFAEGLALSPFGYSFRLPGLGATGSAFGLYFLVALPLSFLTAAAVGLLLERSVIRFLYRRPLESLLATWGVSLVLQQLFRLVFGANNVQVSSPAWLSGNWTVNDILFGWNRVFVIAFAALIVVLTWAALNRTSLGLLIRSVMQNRDMAACLGVRTTRVNLLTFGLGSGLAGLAGAFLSQIGNVGPSLGQSYIIDSFMTVVVGGVGHLMGTVASALGIGLLDQSLQQLLGNPVMGKILVLAGIILFLQWRPAGLFVTRSRSLD